jgi:hypothetical protein
MIKSYFSNLFSNVYNFLSLLDSFNSFINDATVVKYTLYPLLQALMPRPMDKWVLPVPGFPASIIFLPSSMKLRVLSSLSFLLQSSGRYSDFNSSKYF